LEKDMLVNLNSPLEDSKLETED